MSGGVLGTQPTYPHTGQPGLAASVLPPDGLAYSLPQLRQHTASIALNLAGAGPMPIQMHARAKSCAERN